MPGQKQARLKGSLCDLVCMDSKGKDARWGWQTQLFDVFAKLLEWPWAANYKQGTK